MRSASVVGGSAVLVLSLVWLANTNRGAGANVPNEAEWFRQHGDDPEAIDKRFGSRAQSACEEGADQFLRRIAAHDFAWDRDAEGFFGDKFDKYGVKSVGNGLITLITDRAKLSNGFGAFTHITFYCLYDAKIDKVVRYSQDDPILESASSKFASESDVHPADVGSTPKDLSNDGLSPTTMPTGRDIDDLKLDFPADRQERRPLPSGTDFFNVSGTITNVGRQPRVVPVLQIVLRDRYKHIVYSLDAAPARKVLEPGESQIVNQAIIDAPKSARSVEIGWKPDNS